MENPAPSSKEKLRRWLTDGLAAIIGLGVIWIAVEVVLEGGPPISGLAFLVAGLPLLWFIPVPGRGSRATLFVLGMGVGIGYPIWKSSVIHRQTSSALASVQQVAQALAQAAAPQGSWPGNLAAALPEKLDVPGDGFARDIRLQDCGETFCTLVVTLQDPRYDGQLRNRDFSLSTTDGGRTWTCGLGAPPSVNPGDLPEACRHTAL